MSWTFARRGEPTDAEALTKLEAHGHSFPAGVGSSSGNAAGSYVAKLGALLRLAPTNRAVGSAVASWAQHAATGDGGFAKVLQEVTRARVAAPYLPGSSLVILHYGNDPRHQASFVPMKEALRVMLSRYRAGWVREESPIAVGVAEQINGPTPGWLAVQNTVDRNSGASWRASSGIGDRFRWGLPADYPGTPVTVGGFLTQGNTATYRWWVDGQDRGTTDLGPQMAALAAGKRGPWIKRFTDLAPGAHTIEVELVAAGGGGGLIADYVQFEAVAKPLILVMGAAKPYSYAGYAGDAVPLTAARVDATNTALREVVAEFDQFVQFVDLDAVLKGRQENFAAPAYDHPSDLGHGRIAAAALRAVRRSGVSLDQAALAS